MAEAVNALQTRHSRFGLFAPFVLLGLVAVAWSVAWFVIRQRMAEGLDAWLVNEAAAGRQWTCADQVVGGYPFRIEVSCSTLSLRRGEATASLGRLLAVAQVYRPRHVIAEVGGPLRASDGAGAAVEADWRLLQASVQSAPEAFQRASVVVEEPKVRLTGLTPAELDSRAGRLEAHVRPDPARFRTEGAYDVALSAGAMTIPALNSFVGGDEPADLSLDTTVTQARGMTGRNVIDDVERWREAGGAIAVERWTLAKGTRRLEAKGLLRLDDLHRPAGQLDLAAAGLQDLIGGLLGGGRTGGIGAVLGALTGQTAPARPNAQQPPGAPAVQPQLSPLPPLRLDSGRIYFGPFAIPGVRLTPLY